MDGSRLERGVNWGDKAKGKKVPYCLGGECNQYINARVNILKELLIFGEQPSFSVFIATKATGVELRYEGFNYSLAHVLSTEMLTEF